MTTPNPSSTGPFLPNLLVKALVLFPILCFCHSLHALPRPIFVRAGRGLGALLYLLRFRRSIVESNLRLALGGERSEAELQSLARECYRHTGCTFLEIARNFAIPRDAVRSEIQLSEDDRARLASASARGKGIIFLSAHLANWELLAMGVAAYGFPPMIVVKKMSGLVSQAIIERQRRRTGLDIAYSGGVVEKAKAVLGKGGSVAFVMDQNITGPKGVRCNFFGVPASSIRALGPLVKDSGAAAFPICAVRLPSGQQKIYLGPELAYVSAPDFPQEERAQREEWLNAQLYQSAMEDMVRRHPEQWLWIHRRWKAKRDPLDQATAHRG